MNALDFFEELDSKTWKKNIESTVSFKLDELIEFLQSEKENIIKETMSDLKSIEQFLTEEKQEFTYPIFRKWLDKFTRQNIAKTIDNE